ncbi:MAG TPA: cache domain-containing protein [Ktedonobacterales bacterium]|nr:cache domain-containing protein [Ktedonobacterales bacterium]
MMDYPQTHSAANDLNTSRRPHGRAPRSIHLHERFVPLLLALTLLSSLGLAGLAYLAARNAALADAQTRTAQDVRTLRQLMADQGGALTLRDGKLVMVGGQPSDGLVLNGDTMLVDRARTLFDAGATIYQLQGPALTAIATTVPVSGDTGRAQPGSRALGDTLSGAAYDTLLGGCGGVDTRACHHTFTGTTTIRGISYVVTDEPLYDGNGAFVGALGVALPFETVLAPATQQAVLLLLVGMLIWLVGVVGGYWVFERLAKRTEATLARQLDGVSQGALALAALARMQVVRTTRQGPIRRQVVEQAQALDTLARNIEQVQMGLRDTASELWAEMSQPGTAPDPTQVLRSAQRAAVVAARMGTGAMQVQEFCRQIVALMRQGARDCDAVADHGRELDAQATDLRALIEQAEADREEDVPGWLRNLRKLPWLRRQHLAEVTLAEAQAQAGAPANRPNPPRMAAGSVRATTGQYRVTGQYRAVGLSGIRAPQPGSAGPTPPPAGRQPEGRWPAADARNERDTSGRHPPVVGPNVPGMSGWTGEHRGALQRGTGAQSRVPNPASQTFGPLWGTPDPRGQFPASPDRFPNPRSGYPNPPSRFPNPPSQFPYPPGHLPNPPSQIALDRDGTPVAPFGAGPVGRAGRWYVPSPQAERTPGEQRPTDQPPGTLGLPSLSGDDDHIPNWLNGGQGGQGSEGSQEA